MAAMVGLTTSYVGVRDSLLTVRGDIATLKSEAEATKAEHAQFVNKEVQVERDRSVLAALSDLKTRIENIERTQIQILQRLPPATTRGSLTTEPGDGLLHFASDRSASLPARQFAVFKLAPTFHPPALLPGGAAPATGSGNRQERRAVQAAWRRAIRRKLFSKLSRRAVPRMSAANNFKV